MRILLMKTATEIEPYQLAGMWVTCRLRGDPSDANDPGAYWCAQLRLSAVDAPPLHTQVAMTPDEATRRLERDLDILRDAFADAIEARDKRDVADLPGCSGEEMLPLDEVSP